MLTNEERVWFEENRDLLSFLRKLEDKGADIWAVMDLTNNILDIINFGDFVTLVNRMGRHVVESAYNKRGYHHVNKQRESLAS